MLTCQPHALVAIVRADQFGDGRHQRDLYNDESILDSNNDDPTKRYRSHVTATGLAKNASLGGQPLWDSSTLRHTPYGARTCQPQPVNLKTPMSLVMVARLTRASTRHTRRVSYTAVLRGISPVTREPWAVDEQVYNRDTLRDTTMEERGARALLPRNRNRATTLARSS